MAEREPLMSVREIAARLNVSVDTIRRLIARRELRVVRIGHQWRARAEDVERLATPEDDASRPGAGEKSTVAVASTASTVAVSAAPASGQGARIVVRPSWETTAR